MVNICYPKNVDLFLLFEYKSFLLLDKRRQKSDRKINFPVRSQINKSQTIEYQIFSTKSSHF